MKPQNTKKFQYPSVYYTHVFLYLCGFMMALTLLILDIFIEEEVLLANIKEREISGNAQHMRAIIIQKLIAHYLGKPGLMAIPIIALLSFSIALYYKIHELVRYYHKNRQYINGLVDNLDDDNPPPNFIKHIYSLLRHKKKDKSAIKKPNKKEIEKLKQDKLYKKLYGDGKNG